jgi:hypothetical protein
VVDVANGDRESIGGVGGFGQAGQIQQAGDHELNLFLLSESIAGNGGFYLEWGIFGMGNTCGCGCEQGDSADVAQLEGRFCINGV